MNTPEQPYQHLRNSVLRGGRMTKWKGLAASMAPMVGAVVCVVGSLIATSAYAVDECGGENLSDPSDTVVCSDPIYPIGISYVNSDGLTIELNNPSLSIVPAGSVDGVNLTSAAVLASGADLHVNAAQFSQINLASGIGSRRGIAVSVGNLDSEADAIVTVGQPGAVNSWSITTNGRRNAQAVLAQNLGSGDAIVRLYGGTITMPVSTNSGSFVREGAVAIARNAGNAIIESNGTNITTSDLLSPALFAWTDEANTTGTARVTVTGGEILVEGNNYGGLFANVRNETTGSGETLAEVVVRGDAQITTTLSGVTGILAQNEGSGTASIRFEDGDLTSQGAGLFALAERGGPAQIYVGENSVVESQTFAGLAAIGTDVEITTHGMVGSEQEDGIYAGNYSGSGGLRITTSGSVTGNENGIYTAHAGDGALEVTIGGSVSGVTEHGLHNTAETSYGIASQGGTFTITSTGSLSGGSGLALLDAADDRAGSPDSDLIIAGQLLGDAQMGLGSDSVTLLGDGADDDTVVAGAVLDGDGLNADDGTETDILRFDGWASSFDVSQQVNFERFELINGAEVIFGQDGPTLLENIQTNQTQTFVFETDATSTAVFAQSFEIDGDVLNNGTLDLSGANGTPDTVLTITGNYEANSSLILDTYLGDDTSPTDMLVVGGDTSGTTDVTFVVDPASPGAQTQVGILVVDVAGSSDGEFVMANPDYVFDETGEDAIVAGAYGYVLRRGNGTDMGEVANWYLQSTLIEEDDPLFAPGTPGYETLPSALLGLADVDTLEQRLGQRQWLMGGESEGALPNGIWIRAEGERWDVSPETSTTGTSYDLNIWSLQVGADFLIDSYAEGDLHGGIYAYTGRANLDAMSTFGDTSTRIDGRGLGLTLTWYGTNGFYADGQAVFHDFESDLSSATLGELASDVGGSGTTLSLEIGQHVSTQSPWTLIPQAQLVWSEVDFESFTGSSGEQVSAGDTESTRLRLGLAAEREWQHSDGSQSSVYGIANVIHEFQGETGVLVSGTPLSSSQPDWMAEIGLGGTYEWNEGQNALYGEISASEALGSGNASGLQGTIGLRFQF